MSETQRQKIVVVVGPTASGKSGLAIELAKCFGGEVISADSRQVYRGLDIGTAKTTMEEMQGVPHHLIDIVDVETVYTAANFKRDALSAINDIVSRDKLPIIAGGTFFYIDTLLERITTPDVPPNPELRDYLEELPAEVLYKRLEELDLKRALTIDRKNKRRLIRALEIVEAVGGVPEPVERECLFDAFMIGIKIEKEELRARFRARGINWLERGFEHEVRNLLAAGISSERLREIGFEYQLMIEFIDKTIFREEFLQKFVEKNWQYAKRQMTWLRRDESIVWFTLSEYASVIHSVSQFTGDKS